jgi:uncharacterized protein
MASRSAARFDAFRLARERAALDGVVDAAALPRVADRLLPTAAPARIAWRIAGAADPAGRPALSVALDGALTLACQRCLGPLEWTVAQRTDVLLARDDAEAGRLDDASEGEVVLADGPLDPLGLVEDELVLALPFAPRHPDGACRAPDGGH